MNLRKVTIALVFIAVVVVTVSLFWKQSLILTLLLITLAFIKQKISPTKGALIWFVTTGILGPTMESVIIWLGINPWTYTSPFLFNVPIWLFPLYGLTGMIFVTLYYGVLNLK